MTVILPPPDLPTQLQDPWFSERQAWDEWAQDALQSMPRGWVGRGIQAGELESTAAGVPSAWANLGGAFNVVAGRRYKISLSAVFRDTSTTNNDGCGMSANWRSTGAITTGLAVWTRLWVPTRFDSSRIVQSNYALLDATVTGAITLQAQVTRESGAGRAAMGSCAALIEDIGPTAPALLADFEPFE